MKEDMHKLQQHTNQTEEFDHDISNEIEDDDGPLTKADIEKNSVQ